MSSHSSHSHSHHSHSHSKRRRSTDYKAYRKSRYFFAFLLFLCLTLFSLSAAAKAVPLNKDRLGDVFTNREYVCALHEDVLTYAEDICRQNSVPVEAVDSVLTYANVNEINNAFIIGTMSLDEKYSQTVYQDKLEELSATLENSANASLEANGVKPAKGQQDGAKAFAKDITDYLAKRMSFPYLEKVEALANLGGTVSLVTLIAGAVVSVALALIVIALGSEGYRNLRSVVHATSASALVCFLICAVYGVINETKELYFFPAYLNDSIMRYLNDSILAVAVAGGLLTVASFAVMALVWKMKSDKLDSSSSSKS